MTIATDSSKWISDLVNYLPRKLNILLLESWKVPDPFNWNLELGHKSYYLLLEI